MTPSQKCVSKDTALLLRDAGFPQNTERMWEGIMVDVGKMGYKLKKFKQNHNPELYAAPDSQEIGELLPWMIQDEHKTPHYLRTKKMIWTVDEDEWEVSYEHKRSDWEWVRFTNKNEAEARAACWLWLKEQKLI